MTDEDSVQMPEMVRKEMGYDEEVKEKWESRKEQNENARIESA